MCLQTVTRHFLAIEHSIIAQHARHPDTIVGKDAGAPTRLSVTMSFQIAPRLHRRLVAEHRKRKHLALVRQACEALDGDEAVDLFQLRAQSRGEVEIFLLTPWSG